MVEDDVDDLPRVGADVGSIPTDASASIGDDGAVPCQLVHDDDERVVPSPGRRQPSFEVKRNVLERGAGYLVSHGMTRGFVRPALGRTTRMAGVDVALNVLGQGRPLEMAPHPFIHLPGPQVGSCGHVMVLPQDELLQLLGFRGYRHRVEEVGQRRRHVDDAVSRGELRVRRPAVQDSGVFTVCSVRLVQEVPQPVGRKHFATQRRASRVYECHVAFKGVRVPRTVSRVSEHDGVKQRIVQRGTVGVVRPPQGQVRQKVACFREGLRGSRQRVRGEVLSRDVREFPVE